MYFKETKSIRAAHKTLCRWLVNAGASESAAHLAIRPFYARMSTKTKKAIAEDFKEKKFEAKVLNPDGGKWLYVTSQQPRVLTECLKGSGVWNVDVEVLGEQGGLQDERWVSEWERRVKGMLVEPLPPNRLELGSYDVLRQLDRGVGTANAGNMNARRK
jgi:hypothetical protein